MSGAPSCPLPLRGAGATLAHGGGGRLTGELIEKLFAPAFANAALAPLHDGAALEWSGGRLAFSTDSYVVQPLFFPGGDIGRLAVNGTVNDLAMCGARPLFLSAGFILEEGLKWRELERVVHSMARAARAAGVQIVAGDTKVVERGRGDGLYINTAGIGRIDEGVNIAPAQVRAGDAVLLSGDIGRHGIAVMMQREGLQFDAELESDCAPLHAVVAALLAADVEVHCLRDLTRGGLAGALVEIAEASGLGIEVEESAISACEAVRGACELLGLDPLHVANEGRFVAFVASADAARALELMRRHPVAAGAVQIGVVGARTAAPVLLRTPIGVRRVLERLSGEQLPRIC